VYNALCKHFLKARAPDQGLEPFLSPLKIAKRLEPSSPGFDPTLGEAAELLQDPRGRGRKQTIRIEEILFDFVHSLSLSL
jgi:hypothetical protein